MRKATTRLDLRPRRVWLGLTIPGKKMIKVLMSGSGRERGERLIELYKSSPDYLLTATALALHTLCQEGERLIDPHSKEMTAGALAAYRMQKRKEGYLGPSLRDQFSGKARLYGAILTDVRDVLKLRFRVSGRTPKTAEVPVSIGEMLLRLESNDPDTLVEEADAQAALIVAYVISELGRLSRTQIAVGEVGKFYASLRQLRDMLREVSWSMYPCENTKAWAEMDRMTFREEPDADKD